MNIRRAVSDFIVHGGELLSRLRSYEGEILNEADLLLDSEAAHLQRASEARPKKGTPANN
jgi:hypothetical protein